MKVEDELRLSLKPVDAVDNLLGEVFNYVSMFLLAPDWSPGYHQDPELV